MAVSRRLRFEILRRDNHACRYCGATAPDVKLTVDHVIPVALGGSDDPANLVTACAPCNGGKAAVAPDQPIVDDVQNDAIRWARAMQAAAALQSQRREEAMAYADAFHDEWMRWGRGQGENRETVPLDDNWRQSLERFYELDLDWGEVDAAVETAMTRRLAFGQEWRYFCGICWNILRERVEIAKGLAEAGQTGLAHDLEVES